MLHGWLFPGTLQDVLLPRGGSSRTCRFRLGHIGRGRLSEQNLDRSAEDFRSRLCDNGQVVFQLAAVKLAYLRLQVQHNTVAPERSGWDGVKNALERLFFHSRRDLSHQFRGRTCILGKTRGAGVRSRRSLGHRRLK